MDHAEDKSILKSKKLALGPPTVDNHRRISTQTETASMLRRLSFIFLIALIAMSASAQQKQEQKQKKTAVEKLAKLTQPWPDASVLADRQNDAEHRALFQNTEPLEFTLESDFGAINKERNPNSTPRFSAVLKAPGPDGQVKSIDIKLSPRGHLRRKSITCAFVPLRLEFTKDSTKGTAFEGPATALKLITHCENSKEHEQFILRENLAYRLANILSPRMFRARLAKVTYIDSKSKKTITTRYGTLLEDDNDVARRLGGRVVSIERTSFTDLEPDTLAKTTIFEFLLGNTDYSIYALHNVILVQLPNRSLLPVAYDFDLSGLVHAPYAVPDTRLGIKTVLERLYRGPCLSQEQLEPTLATFRSKKSDMLAAVDAMPDLNADARKEVRNYLNDFFSAIDKPSSVNRYFISGCKRTTM
jgi:hypothetical protein